MLRLNADRLKDFQVCERYYDYRYQDNLPIGKDPRKTRADKFSESIRAVATFFFYKKQSFQEPSYAALEHRWSKLWFKEDTTPADIATARNEIIWKSETSYASQAAAALMVFHEEFYNKLNLEVVMVNEPFTVALNKDVAIEGVFDCVLREKQADGKYHYHIFKWITTNLNKPLSYWTFDFAMLQYAFKHRNQGNNQVGDISYYLWDFGSTTPKSRPVLVEKDDVETMIYWCNKLADTKIFVPRYGMTAYCASCPYDRKCKNWSLFDGTK